MQTWRVGIPESGTTCPWLWLALCSWPDLEQGRTLKVANPVLRTSQEQDPRCALSCLSKQLVFALWCGLKSALSCKAGRTAAEAREPQALLSPTFPIISHRE